MRILFLLQDTGKVYGAERATLDLVGGLRAAGEDATVLLIEESRLGSQATGFREALARASIPYASIPVSGRFSPQLVSALRLALRHARADVLHTTGYKADLHGAWAAGWGRPCSHVSTVHGWLFRRDPKERFYGWLNAVVLRRCSRVVALSRHYEHLLQERGIRPERLVRIASGLDPASFSPPPWPLPGVPFTVGLAGRLSSEKNHAMFLRAARRVADAGAEVRFLIAGDGPEFSHLKSQISNLKLDPLVTLAGFLPREDFLARVHVVALTSRIENLPYAVLEAMAAGRPVVATRVGGLPDLVDQGATGWLVPEDDDAALAGQVLQLARDPARVHALGQAGRAKLEREFTLAQTVAAHRRLYAGLRPG